MKATHAEIEKYLKLLADIPRRIKVVAQGVDEERLQFRADKKSLSANGKT